jgi:ribose transport system substrate-binding protein
MASIESQIVDVARNGRFPDGVSRRAFISVATAAGITVSLAACGSSSKSSTSSSSSAGAGSTSAGGEASSAGTGSSSAGGTTPANLIKSKTYSQITTLTNDYFVAFNDGAKQSATKLGMPFGDFEDNGNVNTALSQVGNVKTSGGKMLFGTPATEAEAGAVIKAAQAAGIYYGSAYTSPPFYTPADADHWVRFITPSSPSIAYNTAKQLFQKVNGEGTIIHVPGQKGSSADTERTTGLNKALKEFPNIKIVTTADGNWTSEDARKALLNVLPKVKDFVGVFAQNDSEAAGVIAALDAQNIKGKFVTGFDGNKQNIQYIADGKQFLTSATVGGLSGGLLAVAVFDAINGKKFTLPETFMYQGALLVTPDIAGDVLKNIYGDVLPFDWEKMSQVLHPTDWDPQTNLIPINAKDFFSTATPGADKLNPAWDAAIATIPAVTKTYADAFKTGPLFPYKATMV